MAKRKQQTSGKSARRKGKARSDGPPAVQETQTSDAATIAWTVTVTMVVACDVAASAAHFYVLNNPSSKGAGLFGNLMLLGGAIIGIGSLALIPVVYRVRRTPPPTGFVVFAACAAAAPILALITREFF